jgi:uncharacterized membrane protein YjjP (DUF1212 family)
MSLSLQERSDLVLAFAQVLHGNGQATDVTIRAAERLGNSLGIKAKLIVGWGEIQLEAVEGAAKLASVQEATPTSVDMDRVVSAMETIDQVGMGRLSLGDALKRVNTISRKPPIPDWLFVIAAAAGAAALSVIFGVEHVDSVTLIAASAGTGAFLRRALGRYTTNVLIQPFSAALVAGIIGGFAVQYQLSSSLRLIAICPCLILVPGPHLLNGGIDMIAGRVQLGASRLVYAGLVIAAISAGLLLGLGLLGTSIPVDAPGRSVTLWSDVISAGFVVAAYSVFYSTPVRMFGWPVAVGTIAHALRYLTLSAGVYVATGALVASLFVSVIITPVSRRYRMPFAAIGFASVVSMIPGSYLFKMASGLTQLATASNATLDLLSGTISNGITSLSIILAIGFGLIVPKMLIDRFSETRKRARS